MKFKLLIITALTSLAPFLANAQDTVTYNKLLKKYVTSEGVKYKQWAANKNDKLALDGILKEWSKVDARKLSKQSRAAFRINLYNAAMLDVVLDHYPLKSVTTLGQKPFAIFDAKIISTPSGTISLNTLEKKRLLKDFPDSRIHFAVNCASVSCPQLRNEAFTANQLNTQLNEQARHFANSKKAAQEGRGEVKYSELFNWYAQDFGTKNPAVYLNKFRSKSLNTSSKVSWIKYDWNLNIVK